MTSPKDFFLVFPTSSTRNTGTSITSSFPQTGLALPEVPCHLPTDSLSSSNFQPVAITFSVDKDNDKLLLPYDACPRYATDVLKLGLGELEKFNEGPEIKNLTKRLKERLRITGNFSLTFELVEKIFRLCAFGFMNRRDSSWCSLFEEEDIKVLEYQGDLQNY